VGAAIGKSVTGPFIDIGKPLIRNSTVGYIDQTYFYDEVTKSGYVFWKEDGNGAVPVEKYAPIWAIPVDESGVKLVGRKHEVLENNPSSWEGPLIEGPWIITRKGWYYLFYSANYYASTKYAVGVARARNIQGPYRKWENNPIVHSNEYWSGPGHCSVLRVANTEDDWFMLYHSWKGNDINQGYPRLLLMDAIRWNDTDGIGWPYIEDKSPSFRPTPVPGQ